VREQLRAGDGTVKALFATADGRALEAVLMRYRDGRRSICLSSQSGCPLTCTFCATGQMKFARNLTASEILDQALHFRRVDGGVSNCVFMGMGEPMLNIENVLAACERLPDLGIGHRHTAISTVGWIPGIERLAEQLMPVNERYALSDVIEACRAFYERKRRRVFVEYVMLKGVNDRYEQALELARVLKPRRADERSIFKVNLIPYNPTDSPYEGSTRASIAAFHEALIAHDVPATIRLTRGRDIDAACGQLAVKAA
jgi:23S rRNA (adenine2503-C2)-methyltransferase